MSATDTTLAGMTGPVACYGPAQPGMEADALSRVPVGDPRAVLTLAVPALMDCTRCAQMMREGGPLAALLVSDDYCQAPYTHSRGEG